jgi:hypothetical protein
MRRQKISQFSTCGEARVAYFNRPLDEGGKPGMGREKEAEKKLKYRLAGKEKAGSFTARV